MSRLLLAASDLAALRVPGLQSTKRGINRQRLQENWPTQEGPRGSRLIDVEALPEQLRAAIIERLGARVTPQPAKPTGAPRGVGRPKGTSFFDRHKDVADAVIAYLAVHPFAAPTVRRFIRDQGLTPVPPIHTLRRFMAKIEQERSVALLALRDPDASKSKHRVALGRADGASAYAHEIWELDTTKADVMTAGGRRMILGLIDRYSRRARFMVANSESAQSVRALLTHVILEWGVLPTTIVVDNGAGYINQTVKTACEMLGIEHRPCPPGSPERKPFVERLFGTFSRERLPMLPGFTGHSVAQGAKIRARNKKEMGRAEIFASIDPQELQQILDHWTIGEYEQRIHSGIGTSPIAKAMLSPVPARQAPDETTLKRALSAYVGPAVVGKRGLRWKNGRYWCAELAAWMGKSVLIRRDEDDLGALLVFDDEGNFIGTAINFQRAGMSEQEFATAARIHQREFEKRSKAELRSHMRRFSIERAADAVLRADAEAAGKLATFRPRTTDTPAAEPERKAPATVYSMPAPPKTADIAERVARAESLIARAAEGHDVPENDLAWARAFASGPAFLAFKTQDAAARGERPILPTINTRTKR